MKDFSFLKEKDLLLRLKKGDPLAFEELYDNYKKPLALRFIKLLKNNELAQDALQDLFFRVWVNRSSLDTTQSFKAYLFCIAQNLVIDLYRKASRDRVLVESLLNMSVCYTTAFEEKFLQKDHLAHIQLIIDRLPAHQKSTYLLYKVDGKSYKEIAEILGISPSTINKHLYFANKYIREQLLNSPELVNYLIASYIVFN